MTNSDSNPEAITKLKGLGGWLILVILGLLLTLFLQLMQIYSITQIFSTGNYIPAFGGLLKFELIMDIVLAITAIYLVYLFFTKNRRFPKYYVIFLVAGVAYVSLDYGLFSLIVVPPEVKKVVEGAMDSGQMVRAFVGALIWGSYVERSKRVKATFIN